MLAATTPTTSQTSEGREARLQALRQQLHAVADAIVDQMAQRLVDLPDDQAFGQVEYDLRDLGHQLAAHAHQAGLRAGKKRGTSVPPPPALTATATPASSTPSPKPC